MHRPNLAFTTSTALPHRSVSIRPQLCPTRPSYCMTAAAASHTVNGRSISGPLQPTANHILVKVADAPDATSGGLLLSSNAKEKPTYGEAVEAGPGKRYGNGIMIPMVIEKGDFVLYGKYGGTDLEYDDDKHTIVTQDDILCKLKAGAYKPEAVEPIFDRVLIQVNKAAEESVGGIYVAKTASKKSTIGKIVAVGPGRFMENGEMEPLSFQVGDTVLYGQYAGTEIDFDGVPYILVRMADIYAKY